MKEHDFPADATIAEHQVFAKRTPKAYRMWRMLKEHGQCTQVELADEVGLTHNTVANYLKELVASKVVFHSFEPHSVYRLGVVSMESLAEAMKVHVPYFVNEGTFYDVPAGLVIEFKGVIDTIETGVFPSGGLYRLLTVRDISDFALDLEVMEDSRYSRDAFQWVQQYGPSQADLSRITTMKVIDPYNGVTFKPRRLDDSHRPGQRVIVSAYTSEQYLYLDDLKVLDDQD